MTRELIARLDPQGRPARPGARAAISIFHVALEDDEEHLEIEAEPGAGMSVHAHADFAEALHVREGALTLRLGARVLTLGPGAAAVVPAGTVHAWAVAGGARVRFLLVTKLDASQETRHALPAHT